MDLNDKTVFLAGATGLAGSAIIAHLLKRYPKVRIRAVHHRTTPFIEHEQVEYVQGDLRSHEACRQLAAGCDCAGEHMALQAGHETGGFLFDAPRRSQFITGTLGDICKGQALGFTHNNNP